MTAREADKPFKAFFDPCDDSCEDQWAAPYRKPDKPPLTLAQRLTVLEAQGASTHAAVMELRHNVAWLTEHWHQAAVRRFMQSQGALPTPG